MEKIDTIADTLHKNLTTNENRMLVDNGDIIIIIFDFIGDYKDMELLTTKIMWLENAKVNTKYIWVKNIISQNIAKITQKQAKCFGVSTPPGTPEDFSYSDGEEICFGTCTTSGIPINSLCNDDGYQICVQGKDGSPTCTPPSSEEI